MSELLARYIRKDNAGKEMRCFFEAEPPKGTVLRLRGIMKPYDLSNFTKNDNPLRFLPLPEDSILQEEVVVHPLVRVLKAGNDFLREVSSQSSAGRPLPLHLPIFW